MHRFNYAYGPTYFHAGNTSGTSYAFKNINNTAEMLIIDNSGNVTCSGAITNGSNNYMYAGG